MTTRYANKQEAEEAAHTLSHQPWMPDCTWKVIERDDGSAYVHGTMDAGIPEGEDREQLDSLRHYLGGRFRAATAGGPRSWHGRYGKTEVCIMMPWRARSTASDASARRALEPPEIVPCREPELLALLRDFLDPDPCHFDHHGYCQAHGWFATEPACPHARARKVLES